jgi:hypothetical protein
MFPSESHHAGAGYAELTENCGPHEEILPWEFSSIDPRGLCERRIVEVSSFKRLHLQAILLFTRFSDLGCLGIDHRLNIRKLANNQARLENNKVCRTENYVLFEFCGYFAGSEVNSNFMLSS